MADNSLDTAFQQVYGNQNAAPAAPEAAAPQTPPPPASDPSQKTLDDAYKDIYGDQNQQGTEAALRASMMQGQQLNPDQAAKALPLAKINNIPIDTAARNLPVLEKNASFDSVDYKDLYQNYPQLAQYLSTPENASISHDDIPALQNLSVWAAQHKGMTPSTDPMNPTSHLEAVGSGAFSAFGQMWQGVGQALQNLGNAPDGEGQDALDRFLLAGPKMAAEGVGKTLSFAGGGLESLASIIDAPQQDKVHNIERMAGMVPAIAAFGEASGPAMGAMGMGQTYQKAKEMGLDLNSTKVNVAAATSYLLNHMIGKLGEISLMPKSASVAAGNAVDAAGAALNIVPGSAVANAMSRTAMYAQHIIGSLGTMAGYTIGQNAINKDILGDTKTEYASGMPDSLTMGGIFGVMAALVDHGISLSQKYHDTVSVPEATKESLKQGGELLQEAKTFGRSPDKVNEYLNQELGGSELHVRPAQFQTFFQKMPPDAQQLVLNKMPELAGDLQDALKTGEDLRINQADYHTYIQPHAPELDGWMRLSPDTWSEGDRQGYEDMMKQITGGLEADNPDARGSGEVYDRMYNQLIQRYGQRTAPTGIPDIADSVSRWMQNNYDTLMEKYGKTPAAADFIHSMIGNTAILREYPELGQVMLKDPSFDTFIDKVRNEANGKGKKVGKAPTPIIDYLASKNGIRRGSDLEKELAARDINRKNTPKLFNKDTAPNENQGNLQGLGKVEKTNLDKYGLRNLDEINARELEDAAGHSVRNTENADFVDRQWLLDQIEKEANGEGVDEEQAHHDAAAEDMLNALDSEGIDITKATNDQIRAALDRFAKRYAEGQGGAFYQNESKNLVAVHNLTEENIRHADKLGGLPAPSLAILKGEHKFHNFGEVSLVAPRDLIDPRLNKSAKVFGSDVYSPRYPNIEHMVKDKEFNALIKDLQQYLPKEMPKQDNYLMLPDPNDLSRDGIEKLEKSGAFAAKFLTEKGEKLPKTSKFDDGRFYTNGTARDYVEAAKKHPDYLKYTREAFDKMIEKERIFNGYTNSGNRRYLPHNLDTVVRLMTRKLRDGEGFNYGVGSIRSKVSAQFKSIRDIKGAEGKLLSSEDFEKVKKDIDKSFTDLADEARDYSHMKNEFGFLDSFSEHLKEIADGVSPAKVLKEYYDNAPPELGVKMADFLNKLRNMPTEYFEAKIKRGVGINEFAGAVVPKDANPETLNILKKNGITHIETYERGNDQSRYDAIQKFRGTEFFQGGDSGPHGSITFGDKTATIRLFSKERLDTILHELGHLYWKTLSGLSDMGIDTANEDAAAMKEWVSKDTSYLHNYVTKYSPYDVAKVENGYEVRNNIGQEPEFFHTEAAAKASAASKYADLMKEYEAKGGENFLAGQKYGEATTALEKHAQTAMEEKLADSFLTYLHTGEPPSADIAPTFYRFKAWVVGQYGEVARDLPSIDPKVQAVFSRMFATDEQIEQMKHLPEFSPDPALLSVLNKADQERYIRQNDRVVNEAKDKLFREALRQADKEGTEEYKTQRAALVKEWTDNANNMRVFKAIDAVKQAGALDREAIKKQYGMYAPEMIKYLSTHGMSVKKGGVSPSAIADLMGYKNSDEMFKDFMNTPKKKDFITQNADQAMYDRHGDMMHDGTIEREAVDKFHNVVKQIQLAWELKKTAALAKMPAPSPEAIKAKAFQTLNDRILREVRPFSFYRAEVRAAQDFGKALAKKDYPAAAVAKAKQLLNNHLYRMALDAKDSSDRQISKWQKTIIGKTDEQVSKTMDIDFANAARYMLASHGVGRTRMTGADFNNWFNLLKADPNQQELVDHLSAAMAFGQENDDKPYKDMSVGEFNGMRDAVNGLINIAQSNRTIEKEGQKILVADIRKQMVDSLSKQPTVEITPVTKGNKTKADVRTLAFAGAKSVNTRIMSLLDKLDNFDPQGPFKNYWGNQVRDSMNNLRDARKAYLQKVYGILAPDMDSRFGEKIPAPELTTDFPAGHPRAGENGNFYTFENKAELMGMIAHMGNGFESGSNGDKLLGGYGWSKDNLDRFMERMYSDGTITKADVDTIQKLWDVAEELKPAIWKAHRDLYGYYPSEVTRVPFQTPWGEVAGGYWPAIEKAFSKAQNIKAVQDALSDDNSYAYPSVGRGFTKERTSYRGPLEMHLNLLPQHLDASLRFVHMGPVVQDIAKVLMNQEFKGQIERVDPAAVKDVILPWLRRIGKTDPISTEDAKWVDSAARYLKTTAQIRMLALDLKYIPKRLGMLSPVLHEHGKYAVQAMAEVSMHPTEVDRMVREMDAGMRNRNTYSDEDFQKKVSRLLQDRSPLEKIREWSQDNAFIIQRLTHNYLDNIQYLAAYKHASSGDIKGIDPNDEAAVKRYAYNKVVEMMGSFHEEDVSSIETGSDVWKMFTIFLSPMNAQMNYLGSRGLKIARSEAPVSQKAMSALSLYVFGFALPALVPASVSDYFTNNLPSNKKDDDYEHHKAWNWMKYIMGTQVRYATSMVPIVRDLGSTMVNHLEGKKWGDEVHLTAIEDVLKNIAHTPGDIVDAIHGKNVNNALRDVLADFGIATQLPTGGAVQNAVMYGARVKEGKEHPKGPMDVTKGVLGIK